MNNDTPADAIKPCPFCGGECELQEVWGYWKVLGAHLRGCPFHCQGPSTFGTRDSAIAAWNTRATSLAAQDGLVDALREIREEMRYYEHPLAKKAFRISNTALASIEVKSDPEPERSALDDMDDDDLNDWFERGRD